MASNANLGNIVAAKDWLDFAFENYPDQILDVDIDFYNNMAAEINRPPDCRSYGSDAYLRGGGCYRDEMTRTGYPRPVYLGPPN